MTSSRGGADAIGRSSSASCTPIHRVMATQTPVAGLPVELDLESRAAVLENLSDGVYFVDRERRILYWNKGAEQISGFGREEVLGRRCRENILNHCDEAGTELCGKLCPLLATMRDGREREAHVFLRHKDGHRKPVCVRAAPLRDAVGKIVGAVETFHDDSALLDTRQRAQELERASLRDSFTGVGNRLLGEDVLRGHLQQHHRLGRSFGVLFVDIDRFKSVNDRFGHETGDDALRVVASTLAATTRDQDQVVRWGGDEFLVLIADADSESLARIAERLRALVEQTRLVAGRARVRLTVSVGGTLAAPGDTSELILRRADALLYQSKSAGRNHVTIDRDRSNRPGDETWGLPGGVSADAGSGLRLAEELSRFEGRAGESERLAGVGSWEIVPSTGALWVSSGFAQLLGLSAVEQHTWREVSHRVHFEDRAVLAGAADDCLQAGCARCEVRVLGSGGVLRTVAVQAERIAARDGGPVCVRGTIVDVTIRREAERQRSDVAWLFRSGFDGAPIGMALTEPETGCYVRVNDALCRLLDRSREQLLGDCVDQVTHPDDRGVGQTFRQEMLAGARSALESEKRYVRPDGGVVWVAVTAAPIYRADGTVQAVFSQVIDITERKAHEARFEENVNDALWLGRVRDAIDQDRLVLYRQAIVDLRSGETVQQELLLRMVAEDGTAIAPGEFLPIAERYGLIAEIDRWVIRQAVALAAAGQRVEFNVSAASIGDPGVLRELASEIQRIGADPRLLVVEVTETAMMSQPDAGHRFAAEVNAIGCGLALDDFGTGFSSLSYLKQIPAGYLKIDIEFVRDLIRSETDERLVRGIIGIAREFDQTTVAEGIEDEATLARLRELGVHYGQGYLFGRPEPVEEPGTYLTGPARSDGLTPGVDPVEVVRGALVAFAGRDIDAILNACHPDVVLRPHHETSELTGREAPYRGHDGIRAYMHDVAEVWKTLKLTPTAFRAAEQSVILFGHAESNAGAGPKTHDVLCVWRLRDGLIASVEVFQSLPADPAPHAPTPPVQPRRVERPPDSRTTAV